MKLSGLISSNKRKQVFWALVYYRGPVFFFSNFEIIPIKAVKGQIYGGMVAGVRGQSPS